MACANQLQPQTFKIVLSGDGGVGKTTFLERHRRKGEFQGEFQCKYVATLGVDVFVLSFQTSYGPLNFEVWDTAGQEKFGGLLDGYYVGAHGAIIMYDVGSIVTRKNLNKWISMYTRVAPDTPVVICGTKIDIQLHQRAVSTADIQNTLRTRGIDSMMCEISTKNNTNCRAPFLSLARKLTGHPDLELF